MTAGRWGTVWRPLLVVAAGVVAYSNSFGGVFLFDDDLTLNLYPIRDPVGGWAHFLGATYRRPVALATFAANYSAGGRDPWGYHLVNLIVHVSTALLFFALTARTLRLPGTPERLRSAASDLALAAAVLWVVHPLTTQAVTYVVQRMESLMALWYMAALYAVHRAAVSEGWGRWAWSVSAVLASWLCIGSKEVGMTIPVAAVLYDRCYLAGSWAGAVRRRGPVYLAMAAGWLHVASLVMEVTAASGVDVTAGSEAVLTPADYARSQAGVVLHYLRLAVWPDPLCFDPRWPVAREPSEYVPQVIAAAGLVAATLAALWRWPRVGFLPAAALLVLSPSSSVVPIRDLMFEYRMYLPLAPLTVLAVLAADAVLPRRVGVVLAAVAAVALGTHTYQRNKFYSDPVAIWGDVVRQVPGSPRARYWLGKGLLDAGRPAEAVEHFRMVVGFDDAADPANAVDDHHRAEAHDGLGLALAAVGDDAAAVEQFRAAERLNPVRLAYAAHRTAAELRLGR